MFTDPLPPPTSMIVVPDMGVVDRRSLRVVLRLLLPPTEADEVAKRLPDAADLDVLRPVIRAALSRARHARWMARLPRRGDDRDGAMLGRASGVPVEAAITLALHLGLRLDGRDIADVLDTRIEQVGIWLVAGRRTLDSEMADPCRATASLVGRYADHSLDPDERIELASHLSRCPTCQGVVERSRTVDAAIVSEVQRLEATVGPGTVAGVSRLERMRRGALLSVGALLLLGVLLAGGSVASSLIASQRDAAPLVEGAIDAPYDGWLVVARVDGTVQAWNLANGMTRRIFASDDPIGGVSGQVTLSPGGTRLMSYIGEFSQMSRSRVIVNALDGSEVGRVEWEGESTIFAPTGWIDERRILVSVFPVFQQGQTQQAFGKQFASESRLLAVDVESGDSREVLRGNVAYGVPSPDGRFVAAARVTDSAVFETGTAELAIEIWPIDDMGESEPVATIDNWRSGSGMPIWAADGSRLFAVQAIDSDGQPSPTETVPGPDGSAGPHALVAIDSDGDVQRLVEADDDGAIYPVSAAPDGSSVVYLLVEDSYVTRGASYWRVAVNGGLPTQLSGAITDSYGGNGVVWAPDGETALVSQMTTPYLDPTVTGWSRWGGSMTDIVAVSPDGQQTTLFTHYSVGDRLLGWLPDDALPESTSSDESVTFTVPEPVNGLPEATRLGPNSAASNDAAYVTLDDVSNGMTIVWQIGGGDTERLRGSLADAVWLPGRTGFLTVSRGRENTKAASRLAVLAGTNPYAPLAFESLYFDPAGIGDDIDRRYLAPRVSADGKNTSFFVVDGSGGVELWIANADGGATRIASWSLPPDRIIEPALVANWVDGRTLVVVEPRDWSRGMPETAAIRRVVVADDGSALLDDVIELVGRGRDRGIEITELVIGGDGVDVAWRTRHFGERSASSGLTDTIHLAPVNDLSRDVELTRGSPGSGLAWSEGSGQLLVGINKHVVVVDVSDLLVQVISGDDRAEYPIWIGGDEIWYAAEQDGATIVMRVRVRTES